MNAAIRYAYLLDDAELFTRADLAAAGYSIVWTGQECISRDDEIGEVSPVVVSPAPGVYVPAYRTGGWWRVFDAVVTSDPFSAKREAERAMRECCLL